MIPRFVCAAADVASPSRPHNAQQASCASPVELEAYEDIASARQPAKTAMNGCGSHSQSAPLRSSSPTPTSYCGSFSLFRHRMA
eukprot:2542289-Amphidinium_carterae.1